MRGVDKDLERDWGLLVELTKLVNRLETELEKKKHCLDNFKREIRRHYKLMDKYKLKPEDDWRCRYPDNGYGDTVYVKYKLPYHMTDEEKEEFREAEWCHWYNPWDDGRDCTGVWFTSRIRIIDCGDNETIVIHVKNCDV